MGRWGLVGGTVKIGGRGDKREEFGPRERGFSVFFRAGGRAFGEGRLGWELPASGLVEVDLVRGGSGSAGSNSGV